MRIAEQYVEKLGLLAKENDTMIVPFSLGDVSSIIATAGSATKQIGGPQDARKQPSGTHWRTGSRAAAGVCPGSGVPTSPCRPALTRRAGR